MRPNDDPIALTNVPPVAGALKIPAPGTLMTGISKLAKNDPAVNCRTTVALAITLEPVPKANLHKIDESAFQTETPQLDS